MGLGVALMVCRISGTAAAQQSVGNQPGWTQPKKPWGDPDLRGTWPLSHLISTPFQRPERFGERRFLTDDVRGSSSVAS